MAAMLLSILQVSASLMGLFWGGLVFLNRSLFDELQGRDSVVQVPVLRSLQECVILQACSCLRAIAHN